MSRLNDFHKMNWLRANEAFAPAHSVDELALCIAEEAGELAACTLGVLGVKARKSHLTSQDAVKEACDVFTYASLMCTALGHHDLEMVITETPEAPVPEDLRPVALAVCAISGMIASARTLGEDVPIRMLSALLQALIAFLKKCDCQVWQHALFVSFDDVSRRADSAFHMGSLR